MIGIIDFIKQRVEPANAVLDIGCGDKKVTKNLHCLTVITVDAMKKYNPSVCVDLEKDLLPPSWTGCFDKVLLLDVIEHLPKERGKIILEEAERVCCGEIILLTPLVWSPNICQNRRSVYYNNPWNRHKSLWTLDDFKGWRRHSVEKPTYFVGVKSVLL